MFVSIGHENYMQVLHISNILRSEGSAIRRLRGEAKDQGQLVDATSGNKTRSVIISITGQVVLSAVQSETLKKRVQAALYSAQKVRRSTM